MKKLSQLSFFLVCCVCFGNRKHHEKLNLKDIFEKRNHFEKEKENHDYTKDFNAYINSPEPDYSWFNTNQTFKTLSGGTAHVLNVTSLKWMDERNVTGPNGNALWTHQVVVIVPKHLQYNNVSIVELTGGCNNNPKPPSAIDEDIIVFDQAAKISGLVSVVLYQMPNCPLRFMFNPGHTFREDSLVAQTMHQFLVTEDPQWVIFMIMAKAGFQCMKAIQEFTYQASIANIAGFIPTGGSKRGWASWMVGAATCETCPKIVGMVPIVPIVPELNLDLHRTWRSYHGWSFAFQDYTNANITHYIDTPQMDHLQQLCDPIYYWDRLARLPKLVIVSSDDEFMQFDWTNIWYDEPLGELHLLIMPNAEHSSITGFPELVRTTGAFINSIAAGHLEADRPDFTYTYDNVTGELVVTVKDGFTPIGVYHRYAQTMQNELRDFRWIRMASNESQACEDPEIKLPMKVFGGGNCLAPIDWKKEELFEKDGVYRVFPKEPEEGFWMGYFIELLFKSDTGLEANYEFSTPGQVWPNTLPFSDCTGVSCDGPLL